MRGIRGWAAVCSTVAVLALGVVVSIPAAQGRAAAATPPLVFSATPNGPPLVNVHFDIRGTANSANELFYVRANSAPVAATFTYNGTGNAAFTVNAAPATNGFTATTTPQLVVFTLSGVSEAGDTTGELVISAGGSFQTMTVNVHKSVPPQLYISGTGANNTINLSSPSAQFATTLSIVSSTATPTTVTVNVSPFHDAAGNTAPATVSVAGSASTRPVDVPGLGTVPVQISAVFPAAGPFSASIVLVYNGQDSQSVSLVVAQAAVPLSVEFADGGRTLATRFGSGPPIVHTFSVHETAGRSVMLNVPQLIGLGRDDDSASDAVASNTTFFLHGTSTPVPSPLVLAPNQTIEIDAHVGPLDGPGSYTGTIRLSAPGSTNVDNPIKILVRKPIWFAAILIFFGLLLSFLVLQLFARYKGQLALQQQLADVNASLENFRQGNAPLDPVEDRVVTVLERRIAEIEDKIRNQEVTVNSDLDTYTNDLQARIDASVRWLPLRRQALTFDAAADAIRAELDGVENTIVAIPGKPTGHELDEISGTLDHIAQELKAIAPQQVGAAIEQLDAAARNVPDAALVAPIRAQIAGARAHRAGGDIVAAADAAQRSASALVDVAATSYAQLLASNPRGIDRAAYAVESYPMQAHIAAIGVAGDLRSKLDAYAIVARQTAALPNVPAAPPDLEIPAIPIAEAEAPVRIEVPSFKAIRRRKFRIELATSAIVLVVALLAGLQVLYSGNNTWGSETDIIIAILWGLGIHQTATQGLNGFMSVNNAVLNVPAQ